MQSANSSAELLEIRSELGELGYIPRNLVNKRAKISTSPYEFSKNGYRILVGKNNLQNDKLTTKIATKKDLWFHTKNIPGSHVVVETCGKELPNEVILKAAKLAAENSSGKNSSQVAVDYTLIKNIKKPNGAKPGMVIYKTNQTVYVTPNK